MTGFRLKFLSNSLGIILDRLGTDSDVPHDWVILLECHDKYARNITAFFIMKSQFYTQQCGAP